MPTKLHIIMTYNCSLRCKHCYVYSSPRATGKITLSQITHLLSECRKLPTIRLVYFGGGEPFTQYPQLLQAIHKARSWGFDVGVGTNGYFARTEAAGIRFLRPLAEMGVKEICISNDPLHYRSPESSPARRAIQAANKLGLHTIHSYINGSEGVYEKDYGASNDSEFRERRLMYAGRAAQDLVQGQPTFEWKTFTRCPRDDLNDPDQVYVDAYGYVQICPGIAIGNAWETPLHVLLEEFDPQKHPVLGPLLNAGPFELIRSSSVQPESEYAEPCHCCYSTRRKIIERYPELMAPSQVYGC